MTRKRSAAGDKKEKRTRRSTRAVFLDRDGTLIRHVEFLTEPKDVRLLPGVTRAIRAMNERGFLTIVVTNQPVIARGLATFASVDAIHELIQTRLRREGAHIDAFVVCPHHPDVGNAPYRRKCRCRKPAPGMLLSAMKRFGIERSGSVMIGDAKIDVVAGKRAGVRTVLVRTGPGHPRLDVLYKEVPDATVESLESALREI